MVRYYNQAEYGRMCIGKGTNADSWERKCQGQKLAYYIVESKNNSSTLSVPEIIRTKVGKVLRGQCLPVRMWPSIHFAALNPVPTVSNISD